MAITKVKYVGSFSSQTMFEHLAHSRILEVSDPQRQNGQTIFVSHRQKKVSVKETKALRLVLGCTNTPQWLLAVH